MLKIRKYNGNIVQSAIKKAQDLGREEALKRVTKKKSERITLTIKYHPSLPSISNIIKTHWHTMVRETRLKEIFPQPPMVSYKQHSNLRSLLVRAKLADGSKHRKQTGMRECPKGFVTCSNSRLKATNFIKSRNTKKRINMSNIFNCNSKGVVYMTECQKCGIQYVGQTARRFGTRINEHVNDIKNGKDTANGQHYNSKGHSLSDFRAMVIEKVIPNDGAWLLEREEMWIRRLGTKKPYGLNRID